MSQQHYYRGQTEVRVVNNKEQERVQIVTPEKPSEEIRNKLKSSGFNWSPMNKAWQRKILRKD